MVDWESAFLNDRYADLAIAANFFVKDEAGGEAEEENYHEFIHLREALRNMRAPRFEAAVGIVRDFYARG